ncbi:McrBC 5-methylcytosine restriction system component [compost metagenome]
MVYADSRDAKKGISQSDLYQMLAYAVRFKITEIKLFYPKTILSNRETNHNSIQIKDALAANTAVNIEAYKLSIIDKNITTISLQEHKLLFDNFEGLKSKLKEELTEILFD